MRAKEMAAGYAEYMRKIHVAAEMAEAARVKGGLEAMEAEQAFLRGMEADPVVLAEYERLYHAECLRVLPAVEV